MKKENFIKTLKNLKKSVLLEFVAYAPYDGCHWERNYIIITKNQDFIAVYVSDKDLKNFTKISDLYEYLEDINEATFQDDEWSIIVKGEQLPNAVFISFSQNNGLNGLFYDNNINLTRKCFECENEISIQYQCFSTHDYNYDQGDIICEDCFYNGSCGTCDSYVGIDNLIHIRNCSLCEYCFDITTEGLEKDLELYNDLKHFKGIQQQLDNHKFLTFSSDFKTQALQLENKFQDLKDKYLNLGFNLSDKNDIENLKEYLEDNNL